MTPVIVESMVGYHSLNTGILTGRLESGDGTLPGG